MRSIVGASMAFVLGCGPSSDTSDGGTDAATDTSAEAVADGGDAGPTPAEIAAFNQLVTATQNELTKSNTPGASIAVVLHGKLTFAAGVGNKLLSPPAAVTTSTRFRAASMSKMIVAASGACPTAQSPHSFPRRTPMAVPRRTSSPAAASQAANRIHARAATPLA